MGSSPKAPPPPPPAPPAPKTADAYTASDSMLDKLKNRSSNNKTFLVGQPLGVASSTNSGASSFLGSTSK
jgi:hypothetical protein